MFINRFMTNENGVRPLGWLSNKFKKKKNILPMNEFEEVVKSNWLVQIL